MTDQSHDAHEHHVTSARTLIATFVALVALTILTSVLGDKGVAQVISFGRADIWVVLGIATVKAVLVAMFFMHLLHDKAFNGIILAGTLLFVGLFVGFTLLDRGQYNPSIEAFSQDLEQEAADSSSP